MAEVVSNEHVTHDMRHLVLKLIEPTEIAFWPGQYVDIAIPGTDETRSFSMANTSSKESGQLEFVIRCYPDGLFSHFLDTELAVGDRLDVVGPFGVFTLRDGRDSDIVFVGGGAGHGADPLGAAVARRAGQHRARRRTTTAPGPSRTCASRRSCTPSRSTLPNFRYVPALSEADRGRALGRRGRPDHRRRARSTRPTCRTPTPTSAGRRRWSRRPWTCSATSAPPRSTSTTTSSPPPVSS